MTTGRLLLHAGAAVGRVDDDREPLLLDLPTAIVALAVGPVVELRDRVPHLFSHVLKHRPSGVIGETDLGLVSAVGQVVGTTGPRISVAHEHLPDGSDFIQLRLQAGTDLGLMIVVRGLLRRDILDSQN